MGGVVYVMIGRKITVSSSPASSAHTRKHAQHTSGHAKPNFTSGSEPTRCCVVLLLQVQHTQLND